IWGNPICVQCIENRPAFDSTSSVVYIHASGPATGQANLEGTGVKTRLGLVIALASVITLGASSVARPQVAADPGLLAAQLDELCAAAAARDDRAGITVGVVSGTSLMWTRSYGYADMEKKTPATRETVYRIGSITKQFTALMLLQLVQDGKVHLSDPVEKYFPEV